MTGVAAEARATAGRSVQGADQSYLAVDNLSKIYVTDEGTVRALDQVSLEQRRGEFVSIVGPSGCGKSTLLMIAAGLTSSSDGEVRVDDKPITKPRTDVGIVFQNHVLLDWRAALERDAASRGAQA